VFLRNRMGPLDFAPRSSSETPRARGTLTHLLGSSARVRGHRTSSGKALPYTIGQRIGWRQFEARSRFGLRSLQLMVSHQETCFLAFAYPFGNPLAQGGDKQ
jgi:hypothetical protein